MHDHQGNTHVVLDDAGAIKSWYDYYPYGKIQRASVAGSDARFKFTGKEFDSEDDFDMYYFGARYYDPEIAGWMVTDPADQYHSPYSYVGLNPLNYVDPNGAYATGGPGLGNTGLGGGWNVLPPSSGGGGWNIPFSISGTPNGFSIGIAGGPTVTDNGIPGWAKEVWPIGTTPQGEPVLQGEEVCVGPGCSLWSRLLRTLGNQFTRIYRSMRLQYRIQGQYGFVTVRQYQLANGVDWDLARNTAIVGISLPVALIGGIAAAPFVSAGFAEVSSAALLGSQYAATYGNAYGGAALDKIGGGIGTINSRSVEAIRQTQRFYYRNANNINSFTRGFADGASPGEWQYENDIYWRAGFNTGSYLSNTF